MKLDDTFLMVNAPPPPQQPEVIQLGAFQGRSLVAGPGERAVVWVSGCLRRCPQCIKPEFFGFEAGQPIAVSELAQRILEIDALDGVTYSGGEPFEQAFALAALSRLLKRQGLSVMAYTGYRLEALRQQPTRFQPLLDELDILIDGEYRHELPGPGRWRGSLNQHVHYFTDRLCNLADDDAQAHELQVSLQEGHLRLTGFPSPEIQRELATRLAAKGIVMRPRATATEPPTSIRPTAATEDQ